MALLEKVLVLPQLVQLRPSCLRGRQGVPGRRVLPDLGRLLRPGKREQADEQTCRGEPVPDSDRAGIPHRSLPRSLLSLESTLSCCLLAFQTLQFPDMPGSAVTAVRKVTNCPANFSGGLHTEWKWRVRTAPVVADKNPLRETKRTSTRPGPCHARLSRSRRHHGKQILMDNPGNPATG